MFRTAILAIMLFLGAGPNASLLCAVWCQSEATATATCTHGEQAAPNRITNHHSCEERTPGSAFTAGERRGQSDAQAVHAVVDVPYNLARTPNASAARCDLRAPGIGGSRPPVLPLRL